MSAGLEKSEEVWAEQHIILQYDSMAVTLLEHLVQPPSVVLRQPRVTRLHISAHLFTKESFVKSIYTPFYPASASEFGMQSIRRKQKGG